MKHIPNSITAVRIALFLPLLFAVEQQTLFLFLYLLGGITDVLDGYIARKLRLQSELGARLDSFADLLYFAAVLFWIVLHYGAEMRRFVPCLLLIGLVRCVNVSIAAYKYRSLVILHTWGNKAAGLLVFIAPFFLRWNQAPLLWLTCAVAFLSAAEETIIHLTSARLDVNRQSIFRR